MKNILFLLFLTTHILSFGQNETLQIELDSIIEEANLLYTYKKVTQNSKRIFNKTKLSIKNGNQIVYHSKDTIYSIFIDKKYKNRIAEFKFSFENIYTPFNTNFDKSKLSKKEKKIFDAKRNLFNELHDKKYSIKAPKNYKSNSILIKTNKGYKLYRTMTTNNIEIIPFGNDYLFQTDKEGQIIEWEKIHSKLIPLRIKNKKGAKIISITHSHTEDTPLITATDIYNFRLKYKLGGITKFIVHSKALEKHFIYDIEKNNIEIVN